MNDCFISKTIGTPLTSTSGAALGADGRVFRTRLGIGAKELAWDNQPRADRTLAIEQPTSIVSFSESFRDAGADDGGLNVTFNAGLDVPTEVINGLIEASNIWASVLRDDITIVVDVEYVDLGFGPLAGTLPTQVKASYGAVKAALWQDTTSSDDWISLGHLQSGLTFAMLINHTRQNGGSAAIYLDDNHGANNAQVTLTTANLKALVGDDALSGFVDAQLLLNSEVAWDFDSSDGIDSDSFDFIGVAVHELGHALGFTSSVNLLDTLAGLNLDGIVSEDFYAPTLLDLFRYSEESALQQVSDFTADGRPKYFSIDGGETPEIAFLTGSYTGNGDQASHWLDQPSGSLGLMDLSLDFGELGLLSAVDLLAFDVIGWDLD